MNILTQIYKLFLNIKAFLLISKKQKFNTQIFGICGIVFSMDRPMQLFALLNSYYFHCSDPAPLHILYKVSNPDFESAYNEIIAKYKSREIHFIKENKFKNNLVEIIKSINTKYIFFLVDDNIFKSKFSFTEIIKIENFNNFIFSFRLGKNLNYCYTLQSIQSLPKFQKRGKFLLWNIKKSKYDWNYTFSVDGHIYQKNYIEIMAQIIEFKAPNSFESKMNIFKYIFYKQSGLCFEKSILINLCINRVQNEVLNISGNISTLNLLKYWNEKKEIDTSYFINFENNSAHFEIDHLPLKNRI